MSSRRTPADLAARAAKALRRAETDSFRRETFALPREQAREKARAISCLSNARQIGMGHQMYLQDYDETLMPIHYVAGTFEYLPSAISGRIVLSAEAPTPSGLLRRAYARERT